MAMHILGGDKQQIHATFPPYLSDGLFNADGWDEAQKLGIEVLLAEYQFSG